MKICIYAIAKNEQEFATRFMNSCRGADIVVVGVDPGDTTGDILEAMGARVVRVDLKKFRFDEYRNEVLRHVPNDIDICISLDLDEVLPDGWRFTVERDWAPKYEWSHKTTRLVYNLQWSEDKCFEYDRIHARHGYTWRHANHEAVYALRPADEKVARSSLTITHLPDWSKDRAKNMPLLQYAVQQEPDDPRMNFYLLREYWYEEMWDFCIEQVNQYMSLNPPWAEERAWACIFAARCYEEQDRPMEALAWLNWAVRTAPGFRDPLMELAGFHCDNHEFEMAKTEIDLCYGIKDESKFFESNGAYDEGFYILKASIMFEIGDSTAINYVKRALRINPDSVPAMALLDKVR